MCLSVTLHHRGADVPKVIGIRKISSVDFVRRVFEAYRDNTLFAALDPSGRLPDVPGYEAHGIASPEAGGGWFDGEIVQQDTEDPAQILFSSGTEGRPKAILISHRALANTVERLNSAMRVDSSIREYIGVPITFSFGLGRCRAVAAAGGKFYIPERGFDPIEIRRMLEAGEINAISAVPTLFRTILQDPSVLAGLGARVKWIEIGSQYMSRAEKEEMKELFPNAVILQHYGLTEASRTTFLLISDTEGAALESVGRPFGGAEVQISDEGRIKIRGPHVAMARVEDGTLIPLVGKDGWFTTGDNGHFEGENLFFDGRADDIINSGGIKVDPAHLEQDVQGRLGVDSGIAIAGIPDAVRGEGFFVGVQEGRGLDLEVVKSAVHDALKDRGIVPGKSVRVQGVGEIPSTGTGKIQRKALAALCRMEAAPERRSHAEGAGVISLYEHMFDRKDIAPTANFRDLGGDSLNYVQMTIALEKELGALPSNWDNLPVFELEKLEGGIKRRLSEMESNILLRALAITAIVATHSRWDPAFVYGGTQLLFFLIGYNLARFKSSAFFRGNIWGPLFSYTRVLLIPYFLFSALYMLKEHRFYPDLLFLYTNFIGPHYTLIFPYWFVQVLVQCLLLMGAFFLIPAVRKFATNRPWPFSLAVATSLVVVWLVSPAVWNTSYLDYNVPQRYLAILWLGWCCYFADTPPRRFIALILGVALILIDYVLTDLFRYPVWILLGTITVLYLPTVRVPGLLRDGVQAVGAATFQIFVLNGIIAYVLLYHLSFPKPLAFAFSFLGSIAASWAIERGWETYHLWRRRTV
ncbi:AMP-binding protein [Solirhodobacter olei]|uniref:AMP-binding protein n=1 Tax=Solirhodobacter olei TaxID=2493082 RepID=UPI000FDC6BB7|nr:AMP-binding protein [Solirhodobacter olei]